MPVEKPAEKPAETLVVIDGHYYAYKFFFGMPPLTGPGGRPTGVTYAFANLIKDLRANEKITHLVCLFDVGDSFRKQIYQEYKAHRDPMPEKLAEQLPDVEEILRAYHVPVLKIPGFEADDVIATLAKKGVADGLSVRLCTKDKDIDQLLSARVNTWDPGKDILRGPAELLSEKSITPEQVVDYLCMVGDSADNVPGINGVGPKTAAKLLQTYGTLANVLAHAHELKGKQRENVEAFIPKAELTCRLIQLADVPNLPALETLRIDRQTGGNAQTFEKFGFNVTRFFPVAPVTASAAGNYRILSLRDLPAYIEELRRAGRFAFDSETTGLDPLSAELVGLSFACGQPTPTSAAYLPIQGLDHELVDWTEARALLAPLFADKTVKKFAQNAKYDVRILQQHGITVAGLDGDTMLASWLLDPARESHGIDYLTKSFFGEDKIATHKIIDIAAGQTMAEVPVKIVAEYACEDAQCCWRLAQVLEQKLAEQELLSVYREQEVPIALSLAHIENVGLLINRTTLSDIQQHLEQYLQQVTASILKVAGPQFNPASPKQVGELLFTKLKLPIISSTKSGPSTDASVLEALRHHHEIPDLLLQFRMLSKLIGTYVARLPDYISPRDGRVHTHFKQTGTETGRLSSDSPNLQNIPKKSDLGREIRQAFVTHPDHLFLAADYSQIELRVLAHLSDDPTLKAAFASNADIHRFVAAKVHHIDEAAVTPQQRNAAKAVNFGIIYGQTAFGLSQQLGIPRGEAQRFIDDYFARFSNVRAYITQVIDEAAKRGYALTLAGRRRFIPQLASSNRNERLQGERIALNSTIQGSAADLIKRAMLRCDTMLPSGARLCLQIHDELLVETRRDCADTAAHALRIAMSEAWSLSVPLIADVRQGDTWFAVS
jgi:DNA polymerase I